MLEKQEKKPDPASLAQEQDEDIFGKRPATIKKISFDISDTSRMGDSTIEGSTSLAAEGLDPLSTSKKRSKPPQQVLDNKAVSQPSALRVGRLTSKH